MGWQGIPFLPIIELDRSVPRQWRRCRTAPSSATTRAALIPNENGHFSHSTHTNFHYFLRYFSRLHRTNFSQIPQELFTELIGLALLFSLIPNPIDQNPWAHWRSPMDMMRQG
jgi:hypothetical protein